MKKVKIIVVLVVCLGLLGCGDDDDKNKENQNNSLVSESDCKDGNEATDLLGLWDGGFSEDGVEYRITLSFTKEKLDFWQACTYSSDIFSLVSVATSYVADQGVIKILDYDEDDGGQVVNNKNYDCYASFEPSSVPYSFVGSCLVVHEGDGSASYFKKIEQ